MLLSFAFIYHQIAGEWEDQKISDLNPAKYIEQSTGLFFIILTLVFFNWGFEALKWKFLVSKVEKVSFWQSYKGVLSGVTISIFAPLKTGEYIGRCLHLQPDNRIGGSVLSVYGSMIQLFITILCGSLGLMYFSTYIFHWDFIWKVLLNIGLVLTIIIMFLALIKPTWVLFLVKKTPLPEKWKNYFNVLADFNLPQLLTQGILVSLLRYSVFSLQFYWALQIFDVALPFWEGMAIVAVTFLGLSFLSISALMELGFTRTAICLSLTAALLGSHNLAHENLATEIWLASTLIWLINLALPAIIGAIFMYGVKIFKEE